VQRATLSTRAPTGILREGLLPSSITPFWREPLHIVVNVRRDGHIA